MTRRPLLPASVRGVEGELDGELRSVDVRIKDEEGRLLGQAMPSVDVVAFTHFVQQRLEDHGRADPRARADVMALVQAHLRHAPLAGLVLEGMSPYGASDPFTDAALDVATYSGMPVVRVGRGNPGGMAYHWSDTSIAGDNLSAAKARILLMAAMLRLGALPAARDPFHPDPSEVRATRHALDAYQAIVDTH